MLNLRTIFNGLNNMAIDNDGITIKITVDYDPVDGDPINTRWNIVQAEDVDVPAYIAGVLRDNDTLPSKFFDMTTKHPKFIVERRPKTYAPKTTRERKYTKSAFQRMFDAFTLAMPYLTPQHLAVLTDVTQTKALTGVALPLLIKVDASEDEDTAFSIQTWKAKKNRYCRTPITILGDKYWITNHIFDRNIPKIKDMLTSMVGIEFLPDAAEDDANSEKAMQVILNLIAEGKLPVSVLANSDYRDNSSSNTSSGNAAFSGTDESTLSIESDNEVNDDDSIIV